jgi:hypothetical protein
MKLEFFDKLSKKNLVSSLIKIRPVGAKFFVADTRTDGLKDRGTDEWTEGNGEANSFFSQFSKGA